MRAHELYEYHEMHPVDVNEQLVEQIKTECSVALSSKKRIYRGVEVDTSKIYYSDTPSSPRRSANTNNYYTDIIEHLSSWRHVPQRSFSWICTTASHTASSFSIGKEYFRVLPVGDPDIAWGTKTDFWDDFSNGLSYLGMSDLYELSKLNSIIDRLVTFAAGHGLVTNPSDDFETAQKAIDGLIQSQIDPPNTRYNLTDFLEGIEDLGGFYPAMNDHILNPRVNQITVGKINELPTSSVELWFSSPVYMIPESQFNVLFKSS